MKESCVGIFFSVSPFTLSLKAAFLDSCDARARIAEAQARTRWKGWPCFPGELPKTPESQTGQTGVISPICCFYVFFILPFSCPSQERRRISCEVAQLLQMMEANQLNQVWRRLKYALERFLNKHLFLVTSSGL